MNDKLYWHFLPETKRLGHGDNREVRVGETLTVDCAPVLCKQGLHASERAIDALRYASGPIICRVRLGGTVIVGDDKVVGTERTVLVMADATELLHEFACWCAERALADAAVADPRPHAAIEAKRQWLRNEITDFELAAARTAANAAANVATRTAANAAANVAAWTAANVAANAAANVAAWTAANAAAWTAARIATQTAQNDELEKQLNQLLAANGAARGGK